MTSTLLGVLVGVIHLLGYWLYYKAMNSGKDSIKPEPMSWLIWTVGSVVNLVTYAIMAGDWVKDILPAVCSISCVAIFCVQIRKGLFEKLTKEGILMLSLDICAMMIAFVSKSATVGNIACQVGTVASYVPMIRSTVRNPNQEKPLPWIFWSTAYALDVVLIISRWDKWEDVAYPAVCFFLSLTMALVANKRTS